MAESRSVVLIAQRCLQRRVVTIGACGMPARLPCHAPASVRKASSTSRSEERRYERYRDGASVFLPKPLEGGYSRGNFLGERRERGIDDHYEFGKVIGRGAMGHVQEASHHETGKSVAVKVVAKIDVDDAEALLRELKFLKVLDHPSVVRLYDIFEDDISLYLVMELCEGETLWDHIKQRHKSSAGFEEDEIAHMAKQMLRAVAYCHAHSVVHRDIKPANFMISSSGLKLFDFGVSGIVPFSEEIERYLTVKTGTDGFMAPEIQKSLPYGPPADIFSVGATLFTLTTGKRMTWLSNIGAYHTPGSIHMTNLSREGQMFLKSLIRRSPAGRPTACEALQDPWLSRASDKSEATDKPPLDNVIFERMKSFKQRSKLQKCARACLAAFIDSRDPEVEQLQSAFLATDRKNMGEISINQIRSSVPLDAEDTVAAIFSSIDTSRDGTISFSEWVAAAGSSALLNGTTDARLAFEALDSDGDGHISINDLKTVLPHVFSAQELSDELQRYDLDGDGRIDFQEFRQLLAEEELTGKPS